MQRISRRMALAGLALFPTFCCVWAGEPEQIKIGTDEGEMLASRYAAAGTAKRPAVLLLHGSGGIDRKPLAYERYANALQAAGIDAYLVRYMTAADVEMLRSPVKEKREAYDATRYDGWVKRVSAGITTVQARSDSSGAIGLLGFSLGGYVASATAARDQRVGALAVLYGGLPDAMVTELKHLPPLLEIHGEADANVAFREGERLVRLARSVGAEAEQVPYPGKKHGFDFSDTDPATFDAISRVTRFFTRRFKQA